LSAASGSCARRSTATLGGGHHHAQIRCIEEALERGKRILRAAVHGDAWRGQRGQAVVVVLCLVVKIDARVLAQPQVEFFRRHEELRRRQQRPVGVAALQLEPRARLAPEVLDRARHVVVQRDAAALRKIVEQRRGRFEEQRQVVLDAGGRHAAGNVPVQGFLRRIAFEQLAPAAAEARAARLVERKLARRQQPDFLHRVERALRVDVERLDRLDELVVQVEAVGQRAARRKQIDQPAAEAEFSRRYDLGDMLVAGDDKLSLQGIQRKFFSRFEEKRVRCDIGGRAKAHQRGRRRHDGHVELAALDAVQRRQPLRHQVLMG